MPIHDVGYRKWTGKLTSRFGRWFTISEAGISGALKSTWVRRFLLMSWGPVIYFGLLIFILEQTINASGSSLLQEATGVNFNQEFEVPITTNDEGSTFQETRQRVRTEAQLIQLRNNPFIKGMPNSDAILKAVETGDPKTIRGTIWNFMLANFLRYPQSMLTLMIVGIIVPPLISRDMRSRAFLLYYSRPITRMEYLLGKLAIPAAILFLITLVPGLVLYLFAVMLSPDLTPLLDTWTTPFRIVLATIVCVIPTSIISLYFSSMTHESRFASFAWFTVWGLGAGVWGIIYLANTNGGQQPYESNWSLLSIYSTIGEVQSWIFGLKGSFREVMPSAIMLSVVTVLAFFGTYRRVAAPVRV